MKINPATVIQDKVDDLELFLLNVTEKQFKLSNSVFYVGGSTVLHSLLESISGKKVGWSPKDLDVYLGIHKADFNDLRKKLQSIKKIKISDTTEYRDFGIDAFSIESYTLLNKTNLILYDANSGAGRGIMMENLFRNIDIATLSSVYDPAENKVRSTELAKDAIMDKEIVINPFFLDKFEKQEDVMNYNHDGFIEQVAYQNLASRATYTLLRVKKYRDRGLTVGKETLGHIQILDRFAKNLKRDNG